MEKIASDQKDNVEEKNILGKRHIQMFLLFALLVISFGMKVNLSIGLVAMTDPSANPGFPTFNWTTKEKSLLLSSLFWGHILPQVLAGQVAERHGAKLILIWSMASCVLFTLLIPEMAKHSVWACIICRAFQGFSQGFFSPCAHDMLSKWIPQNERSRMGTLVYSGCFVGILLSMLLTGKISASSLGWPIAFYFYGILGLIWMLVWLLIGESSPNNQMEREHIKTPWKKISLSLPVWSLIVSYTGHLWTLYTLMNEIPTYLNKALNYDISANALLSATPYITFCILGFPFAFLFDFLIYKKILRIGTVRKLATGIGFFGPGISLMVLGFKEEITPLQAVILLIIAISLNSAILSGIQVNHIDLSPNHAGTLMGITNGVGNICGILTPIVVQQIVEDEENNEEWQNVFLLSAGIYIVSCLFFIIFGSGEIQKWDGFKTEDGISKKREIEENQIK